MNGLAGVGHPQREQVNCHQLAAQPDRDLAEVDLGFPAGKVSLRDEPARVASALLNTDLRFPLGHVGLTTG